MKRLILLLCCITCAVPAHAQGWLKIAQKDGGAVSSLTSNKYGDMYCAALNQVYRSIDQGQSWQKRTTPIDSLVNLQLYTSNDSNGITALFALGTGNLLRSSDDGNTWVAMAALNDSLAHQHAVSFFTSRFGDFIMISRATGNAVNMMRSRDNGNTFEFVATLDAAPSNLYQSADSTYYLFNGTSYRINKDHSVTNIGTQMVTASTQPYTGGPVSIWASKANTPYLSTNSGTAWKDVSYDLKETSGSLLKVVGGRDGVVYLFWQTTTDSMHIYALNAGSTSWTHIRDLAYTFRDIIGNSNGSMVASSSLGIFTSEEGAGTWTNSSNGISTYPLMSAAMSQNAISVAGLNGTLFQSNTQGLNWSTANTPALVGQNVVYDMISTAKGHIVCASSNGLWISTDLGLNYLSAQQSGIAFTSPSYCVQEVAPGVLYASTARGLLRSNDDGMSWQTIDTAAIGTSIYSAGNGKFLLSRSNGVYFGDTSASILTLVSAAFPAGKLSGNSTGDMFLVAYSKPSSSYKVTLYRKKATGSLETIDIPCSGSQNTVPVWVVVGKGAAAYVNTDAGMFYVDGSATSAAKVDQQGEIFSFMRSSDGLSAFGATLYGGIYRLDLTVGVIDEEASATELTLSPQPASDVLHLHCAESVISAEVYNVQGQQVASSISNLGMQDLRIETSGLQNGAYILLVHTASNRILNTRIMIAK